ncbi:hypothetical protein B0O99DRAFT_623771 [Bisporella sp. PMI_857]|nr:hypothetical protein B0O99DRAFT_623771 [Bisporella sp. PMI_857]
MPIIDSTATHWPLHSRIVNDVNSNENINGWLQTGLRSSSPCDYCRGRELECLIENRWELGLNNRVDDFYNATEPVTPDYMVADTPLKRFASSDSFNNVIDTGAEPRKRSNSRFSRKSVRILKRWLHDHIQHPYPTEEEKIDLTSTTGLKRSQISNWFANARRRNNLQGTYDSSPSPSGSNDVSVESSISIQNTKSLGCEDTTPMGRWRNSPPENEAASVVDIMKALTQASLPPGTQERRNSRSLPAAESPFNVFRAIPITSFQSSGSSSHSTNSIISSAYSDRSRCSFSSRKRKRYTSPSVSRSATGTQETSSKAFQCTFCTSSFKTQYDWSRHESSVHLPLESWICSPECIMYPERSPVLCPFCDAPSPDIQHLEKHQYLVCLERPAEERTFYRKDHFRQHLHLVHNCRFIPRMESWRFALESVRSRCGFCNVKFDTWSSRTQHLAAHYRSGAQMDQWRGGLGLAPHVLAMVEAPGHRSLEV